MENIDKSPKQFRQAIIYNGKFNRWHEWGYLNDVWVAPLFVSTEEIDKSSFQSIGIEIEVDGKKRMIYEGDIFSRTGGVGYYIVIFRDGAFQLHINHTAFYPSIMNIIYQRMKYIGNIIENPELIEGENNG